MGTAHLAVRPSKAAEPSEDLGVLEAGLDGVGDQAHQDPPQGPPPGGRGRRGRTLGEGLLDFPLQDLIDRKVLQPQVEIGRLDDGLQGDQADDLGTHDGHAEAVGLGPDDLEDSVDRGLTEVQQVHRHLDLLAGLELHAPGLDVPEAAAGEADGPGDAVGDGGVGRPQVHVIGDQGRAGTDDRDPGRRMDPVRPEVGFPVRVLNLLEPALELALPDVGKLPPVFPRGGVAVQEDGDLKPFGDPAAQLPGEGHAVLHRSPGDGHKGADVHGPGPGVLAPVVAHVDELDGLPVKGQHGRDEGGAVADQREDGPVVVRVGVEVQEHDAGLGAQETDELVDDLHPSALADVRDALDDRHRPDRDGCRVWGAGDATRWPAGSGRGFRLPLQTLPPYPNTYFGFFCCSRSCLSLSISTRTCLASGASGSSWRNFR